ncbi:MAG: TonB-dependent receptor [Acidobacteriota bacterium]
MVLSASLAIAQSTASLHGHVVDPNGAAVPGATLSLENAPAGFRAQTTADADGLYAFTNLPLAAYTFATTHTGFDLHSQVVALRSNVPMELIVTLAIAGARDSITVDAGASTLIDPEVSGTYAQINQQDIDRIPSGAGARGIEAALGRFPGFAKNANGAIHPRGAHNQMTFVVDGMPISDQLNGAFANTLDPSVAQTVELFTGNISAEYFGKVGAVANITTRSGFGTARKFIGSITADAAQFDQLSQTTQAAGEFGKWGYSASATTMKTNRFLDQVSRENLHNGGNSERGFLRLDYRASSRDVLRLTVMAGRSSFELANLRSQQAARQDQRQYLGDVSMTLGWVRSMGPRSTLDANASYRTALARLTPSAGDTPVTASQARHLSTINLGLHGNYLSSRHNLRGGGDYQRYPVSEDFSFAITSSGFNDPASTAYNPNLLPHDLSRGGSPFYFARKTAGSLGGAFVQDNVRLGRVTLGLGLRYDRYNFLVNADQWQPRLGIAYALLSTGTVFRASYNRTFQTPPNENLLLSASVEAARLAPPAVQRTFNGNTPVQIKPERQNVFEMGLQQAIGHHVSFNGAFYHKQAVDQQDNNNFLNTGIIFPITLKSIRVNGAEARITLLPVRGFSANVALTHSRSVSTPPFTGGLFLGNEAVDALSQGAFLIDHDQFLSAYGSVQYSHRNGWWIAPAVRYDSGLVANPSDPAVVAADPDYKDLLPYVNLQGPHRARTSPHHHGSCAGLLTARTPWTPPLGSQFEHHQSDESHRAL